MSKLIYCATPSRLAGKTGEIMDFVTNKGYAPLHPFQAFPYERFEGNPNIGRKKTMEWCFRTVEISDEVWLFGISDGTLGESQYGLKIGKLIVPKLQFDSQGRSLYQKLGSKYDLKLRKIIFPSL